MCTVTFIPRRNGYLLGMNRDEKTTRPIALPPSPKKLNHSLLFPREPNGGTWIALNSERVSFALINWYSVTTRVKSAAISRGTIIPSVGGASSAVQLQKALGNLPLDRLNPFRLIGIFPNDAEIIEWRWDLKKLTGKKHPWKIQQWISSGFDEPAAQRVRGLTFRRAGNQRSAGGVEWLRRLHRSHAPEKGPFSVCMHRSDAATVSYTEMSVSPDNGRLRYHAAAPCRHGAISETSLRPLPKRKSGRK